MSKRGGIKLPHRVLERLRKHPDFDRSVWLACAQIPKGEVRTYGWIARKIGRPFAARAVGQALRRNPFAPLIPCHRVVRADGTLGGYNGPKGTARKRMMLLQEGVPLRR